MMPKDDFESRLGQGLKRWAQAGEPTLDLETSVKNRTGEGPVAETTPTAMPAVGSAEEPRVLPVRKPRWIRWVAATAAAAALVLAAGATFPSWAGAAAEWPLVGPVVKEIILKDAGLKWAYDMGLIQQPMAEVTEDGVTVRILGVVADRARTTIIYQITGWVDPNPEPDEAKPAEAGKWFSLSRPVSHPPGVYISKVNGTGASSWSDGVVETPVGLFGTNSTWPIPAEEAQLEVFTRIGEKKLTMNLNVKRTAEASREVPVGQSQQIGGITIHVDSVVFTPVETMLRYRVEKESLFGSANLQQVGGLPYLEVDGRRVATSSTHGMGDQHITVFPEPVHGKARYVVPGDYHAVPVDLVFPLETGATQTILGSQVTLTDLDRMGRSLLLEWEWPWESDLMGLSGYELLDASGTAVPFETRGESTWHDDGVQGRTVEGTFPEGFEPVAVRITRAGKAVRGPWIFDLPN